jgi:hypothetical protein
MKILKKPKILPCECRTCGAVFQPTQRNIRMSSWSLARDEVKCPFCKKTNFVKFEKGADNDR